MRIEAIPIGNNPPDDVNVIIEVPVGGEPIKYEMNKEAGTLFVDRFLHTPMRYPANYGFVPHTLGEDGDPLGRLRQTCCPGVGLETVAVEVGGAAETLPACHRHQRLETEFVGPTGDVEGVLPGHFVVGGGVGDDQAV